MFLKEPLVCRKPKYEISGKGLPSPVKVALTGDWHVSRIVSNKQRRMLKTKLLEIQPDVIILQGDLFDTPKAFDDRKLIVKLRKSMKLCAKMAPTVMMLGNHDQVEPKLHRPPRSHDELMLYVRGGVIEEWRRLCKECEVKLLLDEWFEIKGLRIFGMLQDHEAYYLGTKERGENIPEMRRHIKELASEDALNFKPGKVHWLAAHAPINELYKMPELKGFDVFSFGHTHGACVPLLVDRLVDMCGYHGGIVAPFQKWFPTRFMRGQETLPSGASYIVNAGMVMAQDSAFAPLRCLNFLKAAEVTEVIVG